MSRVVAVILVAAFAFPATAAAHHKAPRWKPVPTGSDQQYRGLDAVDKKTAWVGGSAGEVLRTTDGGRTWKDVSPSDSAGLLFRDVEAESAQRASVLSIGNGEDSRIYRTTDGGRHWRTAFVNDDPDAFYDCMDFFAGGKRGLAMSDPVDGKFRIAATDDSGRRWRTRRRACRWSPDTCRWRRSRTRPRSPAASRWSGARASCGRSRRSRGCGTCRRPGRSSRGRACRRRRNPCSRRTRPGHR